MKIRDYINNGISENLLNKYKELGFIVINADNASIVSNDFAVRFFLNTLNKNRDFAYKISRDVSLSFSYYYLRMLMYLYDGELESARKNLNELIRRGQYLDSINEIYLYDFLLNGKYHDFKLKYEDNEYIANKIKLVRKYLLIHQYEFAVDILESILKEEDSIDLKILVNALRSFNCQIKYMVDDNFHVSDDVTYKGIAKLERRLIIAYQMQDYDLFNKTLKDLSYISHDDVVFKNTQGLINCLKELNKNAKRTLKHAKENCISDIDELLESSLKVYQLYDAYDLINDALEKEFSTKLYLYKIILDDVMVVNRKNLKNVIIAGDDYQKAETSLEEYTDYVQKGELDKAHALFNDLDSGLNNYDYLVREVDLMNANGENQERIDSLCDLGDQSDDPYVKISNYTAALKLQTKKDPICYICIAAAYETLGNYAEAVHYLITAERINAFPDTYLKMMELFVRCKRYDKVVEYFKKYERYYPDLSSYANYLLSIAYANIGEYDKALSALAKAEEINLEINEFEYIYEKERNILNRAKEGSIVSLYDIDDYVSFEFDDEDEQMIEDIEAFLIKNNKDASSFVLENLKKFNNLSDALMYLLSVTKAVVLSYDSLGKEIISFIEKIINDGEIDKGKKEKALERIAIYKNIVKL